MSGRRQGAKKGTHGPKDDDDDDLEALINSDSPGRGAASAPSGAGHNPVFLAKAIFRKVVDALTVEEEDVQAPGGIITLLKDLVAGIACAVVIISLLIFLDHRNVIHLQSAHSFRNAAFQLLNDPETIASVEESSNLKIMAATDYESMRQEIDAAEAKIANVNEQLQQRTQEAEVKQKEMDSIQAEYDSLYGDPLLGLNKFCGACVWANKQTCDDRVQFLKDTYNTRPVAAMIDAMKFPSCIKEGTE